MSTNNKQDNKEVGCGKSLLIGVGIFIAILLFAKMNSTNNQSSDNLSRVPTSTLTELEKCKKDLASGAPYEYSSCNPVNQFAIDETMAYFDSLPNPLENEANSNSPTLNNGCPSGCTTHKSGCDIKGNIQYGSAEKIYHLPGMAYYDETSINPDYGERWFCTEAEAIANGWRKGNDY